MSTFDEVEDGARMDRWHDDPWRYADTEADEATPEELEALARHLDTSRPTDTERKRDA